MPYLPAKQCPICGTVFNGDRCPECNEQRRRRLARPGTARRPGPHDKFYSSSRWRRKSRGYRRRHPFCEHCLLTDGLLVRAAMVDHIVPLRQGGAKMDDKNLQALCTACHAAKTAKDAAQHGEGGGGDV